MTDSTLFSAKCALSDPVQAILGRLDLLLDGLQDLTPLLDLLNKPEGEPTRQLATLLQTLSETAEALEAATRHLPNILAETQTRLTALETENARRHGEQMQILQRLLRQFDALA